MNSWSIRTPAVSAGQAIHDGGIVSNPPFLQGGKPPKMIRNQERLGELVWELGGAIMALKVAMDRRRVPVHQDNFSLKDHEEVRKAW